MMENTITDNALDFRNNPQALYKLLNRIEKINDCTIAVYELDDVYTALLMSHYFPHEETCEKIANDLWNDNFFRESLYVYAQNTDRFSQWIINSKFVDVTKKENTSSEAYLKSYNSKVGMFTVDVTMLFAENGEVEYTWTIYFSDYDGNLCVYHRPIESSNRWFNTKLEAYKDGMSIAMKLNEDYLQKKG